MIKPRHRQALPQRDGVPMLTDSGLETTLIYHHGIDLPGFAALPLLDTAEGRQILAEYYRRHARIARDGGWGFIFDTPTWRASADWAGPLGYSPTSLADVNRRAVDMLHALRDEAGERGPPTLVSGNIGPRGDGYVVTATMTPEEADSYHTAQVEAFDAAGVDMITVMTMTYPQEAIGIARACARRGIPVALSLTVETDGRLPNGADLGEAITAIDGDVCDGVASAPAYFMINCAHPDPFRDAVLVDAPWTQRIRAVRANASRLSHAELEQAETLDDGDPVAFGQAHAELARRLPHLRVFGGCCGTDHRHVAAVADACRDCLPA